MFTLSRTTRVLAITGAALSAIALPACAQSGPSDLSKAEIETIVRDYLLENPEVIRDALIALEQKDAAAAEKENADAIARLKDQIERDPRDYSIGPKDAKVTVVEFFDYNCGFCKRNADFVLGLSKKYDGDVRVVFKELPVLTGPEGTSFQAARAAIAASRQGKYSKFHGALMSERSLTPQRIYDVAERVGLNVDQLKKDMKDASVERQIMDTLALGQQIPNLTGTPYFVVNGETISGSYPDRVEALIEAELNG